MLEGSYSIVIKHNGRRGESSRESSVCYRVQGILSAANPILHIQLFEEPL